MNRVNKHLRDIVTECNGDTIQIIDECEYLENKNIDTIKDLKDSLKLIDYSLDNYMFNINEYQSLWEIIQFLFNRNEALEYLSMEDILYYIYHCCNKDTIHNVENDMIQTYFNGVRRVEKQRGAKYGYK